jgi:adenosine deaminase
MKKSITLIAAYLAIFCSTVFAQQVSQAENWFERHKDRPPMVRQFLQQMPKGADLHTHLSGAVYAETYIDLAKEFDYCVDGESFRLYPMPCRDNSKDFPVKELSSSLRNKLIDRLSVRGIGASSASGHDQFFDSFALFGSVSSASDSQPVMAAEALNRAASQNIQLIETSVSIQSRAVQQLASRLKLSSGSNFDVLKDELLKAGLSELVDTGKSDIEKFVKVYREAMHCDTVSAQPGCSVKIRFILQTSRNSQPHQVFAQLVYAFELAKVDSHVVGIGLVSPEDGQVALRDYDLQMQMIKHLSDASPGVKITLHTGELSFGSIPPEHLRNHIGKAVKIAKASRIGHGVDIGYEDNAFDTLQFMKKNGVAVEICLTSNDVILNVKGKDNPLKDYLDAGVPVVLGSDDEGISRIDLTNEYVRAATEHGLNYKQLKQLSRNSMTWSFLPGQSLWNNPLKAERVAACRNEMAGSTSLSNTCTTFLEGSEKASAQWDLEIALGKFEKLPQWNLK